MLEIYPIVRAIGPELWLAGMGLLGVLIGSVLRDDFRPDSDIDFLVRFQNDDFGPWMGKLLDLEEGLSKLLGRKVDVVTRGAVEQSENYLRRTHILGNARVIYVAR